MATILPVFISLILILIIINNLKSNRQRVGTIIYAAPIFLISLYFFSLLFYQLISRNPAFVQNISLSRLTINALRSDVRLILNSQTLIIGSILVLIYIVLLHFHLEQKENAPPLITMVHEINSIYLLCLAGLILLTADNLLLLLCGVILVSVVVIYRRLIISQNGITGWMLCGFLLFDLIFSLAVLLLGSRNNNIGTLSEIASAAEASPPIIGFLLILPIIIKMILIPFSVQNGDTENFHAAAVFNVGIIATLMLLLQRFLPLQCHGCFLFMLILGIALALYTSLTSLACRRSGTAYKSLLLAQIGLFLIIIGLQKPVNSLSYLHSFTFSNLLLLLSRDSVLKATTAVKRQASPYRSVHVWIFLFAALCISGLVPASGFPVKNSMILNISELAAFAPLYYVLLSFGYLALLLIAFASFKYFFNTLAHLKSASYRTPGSTSNNGLISLILIILNLYPVISLPHLNPLRCDSWIYQFTANSGIIPASFSEPSNPFSIGLLALLAVGFSFTLLVYHFNVIKFAALNSVSSLVNRFNTALISLERKITDSLSRLITKIASGINNFETRIMLAFPKNGSDLIHSGLVKIARLNRKIPVSDHYHALTARIAGLGIRFWKNHELIIPLMLLLLITLIIMLTIL